MSKVLSITKNFNLNYFLLFLFDNAASYFIYVNKILYIKNINKNFNSKQVQLYNRWYTKKIFKFNNLYLITLLYANKYKNFFNIY